jgi:hypothetical protein
MSSEETRAHSELPPSSADKWFHCHAWRRLASHLPDTSSEAAEEGTFAHSCMERHLRGEEDLESSCETEEMFKHLTECVDWVKRQPGELFVESRVDFGGVFDYVDLGGTADVILVADDHLTIGDLKYGRNVVEVPGNLQLLCYLVGAVALHGPRPKYRLAILQPRARHPDGPIREWWIADEDLQAFQVKLEKAIDANYNPKSQPTVGEYCRKFCKALGTCPAAARHSLDLFRQYTEDDDG